MVIIDTSSVLSYIKEMSGGRCSPIRQPHQANRHKSRRARAVKQDHVLRSLERRGHRVGPIAPETRDDDGDESSETLDAIVDGVVEEIIRDTTAATSAAFKSVQGSATAMIFPPPYSPPPPPPPPLLGEEHQETTSQLLSTPEAAASSSEVERRTATPPAVPPVAMPETVEPKTTPTITTKIDKEKFQTLISRSQARRKNLQQSYNEIMSSNSPVSSIQEQHNQYQQQSQQEELSDHETTISLSPRVRKRYYDFDIREVEEYIPTHHHHQSSNTSNAYEWDSAQLRRERRISMQDEIDELTKDMRLITMQRSPPKVNDDDSSKTTKLQQLVEEFEEEWKLKWKTTPTQTSNLKRRIDLDIKKRSINEDDAKITDTVTTRWKGSQGKKSIPDDQLETWWKERQAKQSFSAGERFDTWWKNQKEMKNKKHVGGGGGVTGFQELEGEPTVEDDVGTTNDRKRLSSAVPSQEDYDAAASSRRDGEEEQHYDTQSSVIGGPSTSPTAASDPLINEDLSSHSQSHANNVASGALKIVLSRIDEAKAQFVKALEDNDVQEQSELAALISRLGEAAVNLRKLGEK